MCFLYLPLLSSIVLPAAAQMLYCPVPKVASTTWGRIFLVLSGHLNTTNPLDIKPDDVHHKYSSFKTYLGDFSPEEIQYRLDNYFKFMLVREPFGRLVSAFRNKLQQIGGVTDYFTTRFGTKIIKNYRRNASSEALQLGTDVTFEEFVRYLIDPKRKIDLNEHWAPTHSLCHPCLVNYNFVGKLTDMERDSQYIIDRVGLADRIKMPTRTDLKYLKKGADEYMASYYKNVSKPNLLELVKFNEVDMQIYKYNLPDEINSLL